MPRKLLNPSDGVKDTFAERTYLLKHESEVALLNPDQLIATMRRYHRESAKPTKYQIRLIGPIGQVLAELKRIKEAYPRILYRIMKIDRDRKTRKGDYVSDAIRVYITIR